MTKTLINEKRNEYRFELTEKETVSRIWECLRQTNRMLEKKHIHRDKNSKEYKATFTDEYGFEVNLSVGIGNLKRYFGSRLIELNDDTGGIIVRRVVPVEKLDGTPLTPRAQI